MTFSTLELTEYERGFKDGMKKQAQSSIDSTVMQDAREIDLQLGNALAEIRKLKAEIAVPRVTLDIGGG